MEVERIGWVKVLTSSNKPDLWWTDYIHSEVILTLTSWSHDFYYQLTDKHDFAYIWCQKVFCNKETEGRKSNFL